ncbi:TPA: hypothetical protein ENS27_13475 [bacterium]|nr:hypothetical protein [bacterium]
MTTVAGPHDEILGGIYFRPAFAGDPFHPSLTKASKNPGSDLLFGRNSFKGGVHPPHRKSQTSNKAIEILPPPQRVIIPLSQHIGAPAKPLVAKNDRVTVGQVLAEAGGFVSAPVHASVAGTVVNVGKYPHPMGRLVTSVEIENDGTDEHFPCAGLGEKWREVEAAQLVQLIAAAGIVGMGGASFPTQVKLSPPATKPIDTLIINGAECEPYLTADHRTMLEKPEEVLQGVLIIAKILGAKSAYYMSLEDYLQELYLTENDVCAGCITGKYPFNELNELYGQ